MRVTSRSCRYWVKQWLGFWPKIFGILTPSNALGNHPSALRQDDGKLDQDDYARVVNNNLVTYPTEVGLLRQKKNYRGPQVINRREFICQ
jgi:hypothetical protein